MSKEILKRAPLQLKYAIEATGLVFSYNNNLEKKVINDVSFKIKKNTYVAILGHNGSGKSTMSKLLLGILTAQKGKILIYKNDLQKDYFAAKKHISVVFQNPDNQFIGTTVQDDIAFGLENICTPSNLMPEIVLNAAKIVGMEKFLLTEPFRLSGGQKQRVAIAGAIALNSDIIIFDEATSMLDPAAKLEIKKVMMQLCKEHKKTVISITHDMDEAQNADHILVFSKGKIMYNDTPYNVFLHKDELKSMGLDIPTSLKISHDLKKTYKNFPICQNEAELVEQICRLNLKK